MKKPLRAAKKTTVAVDVHTSIEPFYEEAKRLIINEREKEDPIELAEPIEIAKRWAAIRIDEPWQHIANLVRGFNNIQIEAEATGFIPDEEDESKGKVVYTVELRFYEAPVKDSNGKFILEENLDVKYVSDELLKVLKDEVNPRKAEVAW